MAASEKIVLMATHGPEDPERATIPFVMGCAALASEVQAVIGFQGSAVNLVRKGEAEHVFAPGFPPLKELLATFVELGGKLLGNETLDLLVRQMSAHHRSEGSGVALRMSRLRPRCQGLSVTR